MSDVRTGARIRLVSTSDPYTRMKPGEEGTVVYVDPPGTVHVDWDCGSLLGMVPGEDVFEVVTP